MDRERERPKDPASLERARQNASRIAALKVKELNEALIWFENSNYDLDTEEADLIFHVIGEERINRIGFEHLLHGMDMDGDGTGIKMEGVDYDDYDRTCVSLYREILKVTIIDRYRSSNVTFEDVQQVLYEEYEALATGKNNVKRATTVN